MGHSGESKDSTFSFEMLLIFYTGQIRVQDESKKEPKQVPSQGPSAEPRQAENNQNLDAKYVLPN